MSLNLIMIKVNKKNPIEGLMSILSNDNDFDGQAEKIATDIVKKNKTIDKQIRAVINSSVVNNDGFNTTFIVGNDYFTDDYEYEIEDEGEYSTVAIAYKSNR